MKAAESDHTGSHPTERSPDPHLSIHHVHVFVRDLDRSIGFFTEQLGFRKLFDHYTENVGRFVAVAPPHGNTILGLIAPQPGSAEFDLIGRSGHVVLVTDDITAVYTEWRSRGLLFDRDPQATDWKGIFSVFADPDGNSFALMSQDYVSRELESQRRALAERAESERRAMRDMEIAREFQTRLLPQSPPPLTTLEFAGRCLQASQVGGDYFDCFPLGGRSVGLLIGDISGKGIAAALLMANLQAVVRAQSFVAVEDPLRFVRSLNRHLFDNTVAGAYATLFFGEYNEESGQLRYVNCGHPPAMLIRADGHAEQLPATTTVLGLFAAIECSVGEAQLRAGDTLVLYTDGVTEGCDLDGVEFGTDRLISTLLRDRTLGAEALLEVIVRELQEFGGNEQQDDVTLVVAKRHHA